MAGELLIGHADHDVAPEIVRVSVARVGASEVFLKAGRQKALLNHLAENVLEGLGRAPTLEELVPALYKQFDAEVGAKAALSDLRRLSALLDEYSLGEGADDAVRISLDPATRHLSFELAERAVAARETEVNRPWAKNRMLFAVFAALLSAALWIFVFPAEEAQQREVDLGMAGTGFDAETPTWSPLLPDGVDVDFMPPKDLDALGRRELLPFPDINRQKYAVAHFKYIIASYPNYAGAYASAAHCLASLAIVTRGSGRSRQFLAEAIEMRDAALSKAPDDPWTVSAAAWVAIAERNFDDAVDMSERSIAMAPRDGNVLDFYALLALATNRFESAQRSSDPAMFSGEPDPRQNNLITHGLASFHLEDYARAVNAIESALERNAELNAIRAMYLAAAYQALGETEKAEAAYVEMKTRWPMFRPELVHQLLLREPDAGEPVLTMLADLGWEFAN